MANPGRKNPAAGKQAKAATTQRHAERAPFELRTPWVLGIFSLVTVIFFWSHLSGSAFLWEDFKEFTYPNEVFAARNFMNGSLPFWNPFSFNGMPFLADLQIGFFYPGNILMYVLSGGTLGVWLAQFVVILHYPLAMFGAWKLSRSLGISSWGSLVSGLAYGLTGMMVVHMIHPNVVEHLAWFPLIFYFFRRGLVERSWFHALAAGTTLGVAMLTGHPQSALYIVLFLFAYTCYQFVADIRSQDAAPRTGGVVQALLCAALPIAVGVGFFAIQLLPSQELAGLSERAVMPYEKTLEGKLEMGQLLTVVAPKYFGTAGGNEAKAQENPWWFPPEKRYFYWETAIYFGVTTLLLSIVGLASRRLGGMGWFLAAMGALGLFYALGDGFFVHPIMGRLPLFSSFRIPTRMAIYLSLGAAVLAGAGVDRMVRGVADNGLARVALIAGGVVVAMALFVVTGMANTMFNPPEALIAGRGATGVPGLLLGALTALVAWLALRDKISATATGGVVVALVIIDLALFGIGQNSAKENPEKDVYAAADAQFTMLKATPPDKLFRVSMRNEQGMLMPRNQGPYSGIMLYEGYNPLLLARRVPPTASVSDAFDLLDIRYGLGMDSATGNTGLVERPTALPHARMVYNAVVVPPAEAKEKLAGGSIDTRSTVMLEEDPGLKLDGTGTGTATIIDYSAGHIAVDVKSDKGGVLVLSEIWYPAWQVTVDGAPAKLLQANYSLRGVAVAAGNHRVEMVYESTAFSTGRVVTIVTAVVAVAGMVVLARRKKSPEDE